MYIYEPRIHNTEKRGISMCNTFVKCDDDILVAAGNILDYVREWNSNACFVVVVIASQTYYNNQMHVTTDSKDIVNM